jgi:hypothetical protein
MCLPDVEDSRSTLVSEQDGLMGWVRVNLHVQAYKHDCQVPMLNIGDEEAVPAVRKDDPMPSRMLAPS